MVVVLSILFEVASVIDGKVILLGDIECPWCMLTVMVFLGMCPLVQ